MDAWKAFEQYAARLFGCRRAWANSGQHRDFPPPEDLFDAPAVGQCKNTKELSLNQLTKLAEVMEADGLRDSAKGQKLGVVCTKVRRGHGQKSATLVVMTDQTWLWLLANPETLRAINERREQEGAHVKV